MSKEIQINYALKYKFYISSMTYIMFFSKGVNIEKWMNLYESSKWNLSKQSICMYNLIIISIYQ